MRTSLRYLLALVAALAPAGASCSEPADAIAGIWVGTCEINGRAVFLRLKLEPARRGWSGSAEVRALGIGFEAIRDAHAEGERLALAFAAPDGPVRLSGRITGTVLEGTVESGEKSGRLSLRKRYPITAAQFDPLIGDYEIAPENVVLVGRWDEVDYTFLAEGERRIEIVPTGPREFVADDLRTIRFERDGPDPPEAALVSAAGASPIRAPRVDLYDEQRVFFENGNVRLAGSLVIPPGAGPHPALVFVHGSGPQTRESYRLAADRFARGGVACLFYDKRGTGESGGDWRAVGFEVLADDALAGVKLLNGEPRIAADKIGLWGISQAGWIIPLAAAKSDDVAFIVPISGAAVTPVEQEAWRRRQNLVYLGVDERFIDAGRKAHVMVADWQRRRQLGQMPLVNPFTSDELNMYHDAATVLAQVRQPVLAIYGELDTLTPPREGAAMWASILRARGNDDFSVRLFPKGTHGLTVGGRTGVPFEVLAERRFVPGFWDTMLAWIHHHAHGPEYADARRVDVDAAAIPVESRGMHALGWYGSGAVQPWLLAGYFVICTACTVALPLGWLWRKLRRAEPRPIEARRTARWAALTGAMILVTLGGLMYVLHQVADAEPHPLLALLATAWNVLVAGAWASLLAGAMFLRQFLAAWGMKKLSRTALAGYALVGVAVVSWAPFVYYWDLLMPAR
jgi:fermentation-respiration switch protein FrsA (DUF1100 family)